MVPNASKANSKSLALRFVAIPWQNMCPRAMTMIIQSNSDGYSPFVSAHVFES